MAEVTVYVSDEAIIEHLKAKRGLDPGISDPRIGVVVEAQPPIENSTVSHVVTLSIRYGLDLGDLRNLADV